MKKLKNDLVLTKKTNLNKNKKYFGNIWLWLTCMLFFISMVACNLTTSSEDTCLLFFMSTDTCSPTTSSDDNGGGNQLVITLTYPSSATFGTGGTITPVNTPSQATSYTLTHAAVGTVTPPTIDATTGDITTTATTTAGFYTVKALDGNNNEITNSSFTVTYVVADKAVLESEIKGSTATGRKAWGNDGNFNYIDTSRVTDMSSLFNSDTTFNGDISNWDVSSVTTMQSMFILASVFNQNIGGWDVSSVTTMRSMFFLATAFNQDLSSWDVRSVTTMRSMFFNTRTFNQDLSSWDVRSVTDMSNMFYNATAFNQDLEDWGEHLLDSADISDMFNDLGVVTKPTWCTTNRNC